MDLIQKDFTSLKAWQQAHRLALEIYKISSNFPTDEKYNLTSQIRRSAHSVSSNIAEGHGRYYYKENMSFCRKARGSLDETINHLVMARDLQYQSTIICEQLLNDYNKLRQLLNGYIRYLDTKKPA